MPQVVAPGDVVVPGQDQQRDRTALDPFRA